MYVGALPCLSPWRSTVSSRVQNLFLAQFSTRAWVGTLGWENAFSVISAVLLFVLYKLPKDESTVSTCELCEVVRVLGEEGTMV